MPVYLITIHAYRSWSEGHSKGYVQRDQGLKPSSPRLADWRNRHASHDPARFDSDDQELLHQIMIDISKEKCCTLHAASATPTHLHELTSFEEPKCQCDGAELCRAACLGRIRAEKLITRLKQKLGQALAKKHKTNGRPYFSRGWDLTPIRGMPHFQYHVETYLPKHVKEGGIVRIYK